MHHPEHADKRAKSPYNCIGLKEFRGPMGGRGENFLQQLMGCIHSLVVEGNG